MPNAIAAQGLASAILLQDRDNALRVPVSESIVRSGFTAPASIDLADQVVEPTREAVGLGADLLIGFPPGSPEPHGGTAVVIALLPSSDEVAFLARCTREHWTDTLTAVAVEFGGPSVVEFARKVVDPTSPEAEFLRKQTAPPTTLAWEDLDPALRLLDPIRAGTPQTVIDQLTTVPILIHVPSTWNDLATSVCFKLSIGWHYGCEPTGPGERLHIQHVFVVPGEPLEAWLMGDPARLEAPIALLIVIEKDLIADVTAANVAPSGEFPENGLAIEFALTGDPTRIDQVKDALAAGTIGAEVEVISLAEAFARQEAVTPQAVPAEGP